MPVFAPRTALSRSASAKTMLGDLPPSSSETFFNESAASRMMVLPTLVEPVKAMASTPGCRTRAAPARVPRPGTTLSIPGGKPASAASSPSRRAVRGVSMAGLRTTAFPHANAGATFQVASESGKFHGTMHPTTPTGSRRV